MKRLSGWQRIGLIASVIWFLYAAITGRLKQVESVGQIHHAQLSLCAPEMLPSCLDSAHRVHAELLQLTPAGVIDLLVVSIAPVAAGWLFAWIAIGLYKWVEAGFQQKS